MKITKIAQSDPDSNTYTAQVSVDVYGYPETHYVEANKIPIKFGIDIDAREWGIKGIVVYLQDEIIEIPLLITDNATDAQQEKVLQVVIKNINQHDYNEMGAITLDKLNLWVDANFNVDYKKSSLDIKML